ncbi:MAG: NADH-quinone oxidoreductase subunit C [Syntrophales bacterium]
MDSRAVGELLKERFPAAVRSVEEFRGETTVTVDRTALREVMRFLKEDAATRYDLLVDMAGVDCGDGSPRLMVAYLLNSLAHNNRLRVKTGAAEGAEVDTVSDLWQGAEWLEREVYDMFGIRFAGHPELRRILLTEDFVGHPLRKEFPLAGHEFDKPVNVCAEEETGYTRDV